MQRNIKDDVSYYREQEHRIKYDSFGHFIHAHEKRITKQNNTNHVKVNISHYYDYYYYLTHALLNI